MPTTTKFDIAAHTPGLEIISYYIRYREVNTL